MPLTYVVVQYGTRCIHRLCMLHFVNMEHYVYTAYMLRFINMEHTVYTVYIRCFTNIEHNVYIAYIRYINIEHAVCTANIRFITTEHPIYVLSDQYRARCMHHSSGSCKSAFAPPEDPNVCRPRGPSRVSREATSWSRQNFTATQLLVHRNLTLWARFMQSSPTHPILQH
jgi:hypothetical protein